MDYQRIYNQIIERARDRVLKGYGEKHHILPRCLEGSDDKENLVRLTAREHFLCHWLLTRIYPENRKLLHAFWMMCNTNGKGQQRIIPSSTAYQEAREKLQQILKLRKDSPETKLLKIKNNARTGKPNWNSGKGGYKLNILPRPMSQSHKDSISRGNKNKKKSLLICPKCKKEGSAPAMIRWHFNNCKINRT